MKNEAGTPALIDAWKPLLAVLPAAVLLAAVVWAPAAMQLVLVAGVVGWFLIARKSRLSIGHRIGVIAGLGCVLLLQFANLTDPAARLVNWCFLVTVTGLLASATWQLIKAGLKANREIRTIREGDLDSRTRP